MSAKRIRYTGGYDDYSRDERKNLSTIDIPQRYARVYDITRLQNRGRFYPFSNTVTKYDERRRTLLNYRVE